MPSPERRRVALRSNGRLACAALVGFILIAAATAHAADPAPAADASATPKPATTKKAAGKATKKSATSARKKKAAADAAEAESQSKRRRIGASPAYVVGDSDAHLINEAGPPLEAFPTDAKAVKKAFAETRRDQLVDAEKAARDDKTPDRWRTVLFALRGLPERNDPETCFWRVLSFYRLGEIARARTLREGCELPGKDSATLNAEDATASGVPAMGTVAADDGFGQPSGAGTAKAEPKPAPTAAPYTGPSPRRP